MTSFPAEARHVRDTDLPVHHRLWALRGCALSFPPYGFRATWHHLVRSARIPYRLDDDPDALVRAVDELEAARQLALGYATPVVAARRRSKAGGQRVPVVSSHWVFGQWSSLAYCPDFTHHPDEPLPVVVGRVVAAHRAGTVDPGRCTVCGADRTRPRACTRCGVHPDGPAAPSARFRHPDEADRWRRTWQRSGP
ncbi:hypothetical protein [Micromonospora sp. NPDC004704]